MNTITQTLTTANQSCWWDATLEVQDWRRKTWRVNYAKHVLHARGWCVDWQIIAPDGLVQAFKNNDLKLAERCIDRSGLVNQELLEYEFKWWVNHHTNTINIKLLKAIQSEVQDD